MFIFQLWLLFCIILSFSPRFSSFLHVSLLFCVLLSTAISAIAPTVQYSSFSFLLHSTIPFHCNKQSDLGSSDYNFDISFSSVCSSSEYYHLHNKCNVIFFLHSFKYFLIFLIIILISLYFDSDWRDPYKIRIVIFFIVFIGVEIFIRIFQYCFICDF